jgi:FMN reductase
MAHIVLVASSPTTRSRMDAITRVLQGELIRAECAVKTVQLRDLPQSALLVGNREHPQIRWTQRIIRDAQAIVLITPTYQASRSTLLSAWLSLLPTTAFAGKTVQAVGLGAIRSHATGLGAALGDHEPGRILPGCFLYERWLQPDIDGWNLDSRLADRISRTAVGLRAEIDRTTAVPVAS